MRITIFGSGYVGLVAGACLADAGNHVTCVDTDAAKIARLQQGEIPIFEPGLEDLIRENSAAHRLVFTTDAEAAVRDGRIIFIAVGTPPDEDGSADLRYVQQVARTIGEHMDGDKVVVDKSTVPVGTAEQVQATIDAVLAERGVDHRCDVVSNPEFLKEGAAVGDFMRPDRVIIGSESAQAAELMRELYRPFSRSYDKFLVMDRRSAELTKYAANAMLATRISFMNELANLAERLGADIEHVRQGIGSDRRIGYHFIYPGPGYGGSCFPKDVQALSRTAKGVGFEARILDATEAVNTDQKRRLFEKVQAHFDGDLAGKVFAVWGLAFKPNTDDMREAPSRVLIEALLDAGAAVRAHDPEAAVEAARVLGEHSGLVFAASPEDALEGADALMVVTEWSEYRSPDFDLLASQLAARVIFDGRNIYQPEAVERYGLAYYGIGRGRGSSDAVDT
jgi:UDPglucose 6-dehydrogenase